MRHIIVLGCFLLGIPAALSVGRALASHHPAHHAVGIDSRLLLVPRTLTVTASLSGASAAHLRISPAIPGVQRISLRLPARIHPAGILLRARMSGMQMTPTVGRLGRRNGVYVGQLRLPMFGTYRVAIELPQRPPVTVRVTLPLPGQ
ncbi:MAG TPA: hypothetical protein VFB58_02865 [Chloroflexota bacterium]|nr:hypothetical protein [Chloroflexota bacterium]